MANLRIKWPNDVLADGNKICGVLVEPRLGAGRIEFAVAGIGITVGQAAGDFPPELRSTATSCRTPRIWPAPGARPCWSCSP